MPGRPLTILQLTHQGGGSGSTVAIANLSRQLARRGHRVLIGCRLGTMLAGALSADRTVAASPAVAGALRRRLHPRARLRVVPNGIDCDRVDAPPSAADVVAAREALGDPAGRPVVLVLARRKDQHVLLE